MCVGGDLMEKTLTEATELIKKSARWQVCEEIGKHDFRESQNAIQV
jgi:hypothetical protein